jgi:hypothetical protein
VTRHHNPLLVLTTTALLWLGLLSGTVPVFADKVAPDAYQLPSWGSHEPLLAPRLWPGNPSSPSKPTTIFIPEIQLPPEVDPTLIPDLHLADYFGTIPESYLVDPQTLLTAHERTSINRALDEHFTNHGYSVHILLFQKTQKIPNFQSLEDLHARWFGREHGVIVGFWLGSPTRTTATFGPALREDFGERLDRSFADALGQSYTKSYPFSQIDHFTYTLLGRLAHIDAGAAEEELAQNSDNPLTIPDFSDETYTSWVPIAAGGSALALGAAALGVVFIAKLRKRERQQKLIPPLILRADPHAQRLGAPHSGGSSAVIKIVKTERETSS